MAILYGAVLMGPTVLYLYLFSGTMYVSPAIYVTALLLTEIARRAGKPLTRQEVNVLFYAISWGAALPVTLLTGTIFRAYFITAPYSKMFKDPFTGEPIVKLIPSWWVPPLGSPVYAFRTLFHPDWLVPLLLMFANTVFNVLTTISLALICAQLYIEEESLPWPRAQVQAEACIVMAERQTDRARAFTMGAIVSMFWAFAVYFIPIVSRSVFDVSAVVIPAPWIDLSTAVENYLPGAILGIGTDIFMFAISFMISERVLLFMLISSLSSWVIGNHLAYLYPGDFFAKWREEWTQGMTIPLLYQRSYLHIWASPIIGVSIAAAVIPLFRGRRYVLKAFSSLAHLSERSKEAGYLPLPIILAMYLIGTGGSVALFHFFVPGFPLWMPILISIGWVFIYTIVAARMEAEAAIAFPPIPYLWQGVILFSGYQGIDAWFLSPLVSSAGSSLTVTLKGGYLTNTKLWDLLKAYIIVILLCSISGLVFINLFWRIAPIPSQTYPWTMITWPIEAMMLGSWITRQFNIIKPTLIAVSFLVVTSLYIVCTLLRIPFSLIGIATGLITLPPHTITMFLGGFVGKRILSRLLGREWFENYRAVLIAGIAAGQGVMVGLASAIALISKNQWVLPY